MLFLTSAMADRQMIQNPPWAVSRSFTNLQNKSDNAWREVLLRLFPSTKRQWYFSLQNAKEYFPPQNVKNDFPLLVGKWCVFINFVKLIDEKVKIKLFSEKSSFCFDLNTFIFNFTVIFLNSSMKTIILVLWNFY